MRKTSDELITQMRLNSSTPSAQTKFNDARCLLFLNEELQLLQSKMLELRADFFTTSVDLPLVASQSEYSLPEKAVGWGLYDWGYVDVNDEYRSLSQTSVPLLDRYSEVSLNDYPTVLFLQGDKIVCRPKISASPTGSIRLFYERIQNQLVLVSECGKITAVSTSGTNYVLALDGVPIYASGVDCVGGKSPYEIVAEAATATVVGLNMTVAQSAFNRAPVVGDYICPTGKTCIPHVPDLAMLVLAQLGTVRLLEASSDTKGLQSANATLARMMDALLRRCQDRVKARPKKAIPKNYLINMFRR